MTINQNHAISKSSIQSSSFIQYRPIVDVSTSRHIQFYPTVPIQVTMVYFLVYSPNAHILEDNSTTSPLKCTITLHIAELSKLAAVSQLYVTVLSSVYI